MLSFETLFGWESLAFRLSGQLLKDKVQFIILQTFATLLQNPVKVTASDDTVLVRCTESFEELHYFFILHLIVHKVGDKFEELGKLDFTITIITLDR